MIKNQNRPAQSGGSFTNLNPEPQRETAGSRGRAVRKRSSEAKTTVKKKGQSPKVGRLPLHDPFTNRCFNVTKRIKTHFGTAEFVLQRQLAVFGVHYRVSVRGEGRQNHCFSMEIESGEWYIANTSAVPAWITKLESVLSEAITEHKPFAV